MIDAKKFEQFAREIQETLPKGIRDLANSLEKKIHQKIQNQCSRMNLVSREEFDVQAQILLRTREKLEQLELRMNTLETMLKDCTFTISKSAKKNNSIDMDHITDISSENQTILDVVEDKKSTEDIIKNE